MGVRESLNQKPMLTAIAIAMLLMAIAVFIFFRDGAGDGGTRPSQKPQAFFTIDDGKSWFLADASNVAPFKHEGKDAVRAYVYTCDGGKTKFVGSLERYPPQVKARIDALRAAARPDAPDDPAYDPTMTDSMEVKRPGAAAWVSIRSPAAAEVQKAVCPDGGKPTAVLP